MSKLICGALLGLTVLTMSCTKKNEVVPEEPKVTKTLVWNLDLVRNYSDPQFDSTFGSLHLMVQQVSRTTWDSKPLWDTSFSMRQLKAYQAIFPMQVRKTFDVKDGEIMLRWGQAVSIETRIGGLTNPSSSGMSEPVERGSVTKTAQIRL